jgi:hypothetical protein
MHENFKFVEYPYLASEKDKNVAFRIPGGHLGLRPPPMDFRLEIQPSG